MLNDGNNALYPLAKDCVSSIRDPLWLDLPPIQCLDMNIVGLPNVAANCKNKAAVIALTLKPQSLIPLVLRCDLERVRLLLHSLEKETSKL